MSNTVRAGRHIIQLHCNASANASHTLVFPVYSHSVQQRAIPDVNPSGHYYSGPTLSGRSSLKVELRPVFHLTDR